MTAPSEPLTVDDLRRRPTITVREYAATASRQGGTMIRLTVEREAAGWTKRELGARSDLHPVRIGQIENLRVRPYDVELQRIARALDYHGDPSDLVREVQSHDAA